MSSTPAPALARAPKPKKPFYRSFGFQITIALIAGILLGILALNLGPDAEGNPKAPFEPVVETNTWKALPAVKSGRALGLFCPGNNSYGPVLQDLDSLDRALASLPKE